MRAFLDGTPFGPRFPNFIRRKLMGKDRTMYGLKIEGFDVGFTPPDRLNLDPVYKSFLTVERHPGQLILDITAWSGTTLTLIFSQTAPYIWWGRTPNTQLEYDDADNDENA